MKDIGIIRCDKEQAIPLIVGYDTVYVHTDIEEIDAEENLYQCHEVQYGKDEYIRMMAEKNAELDNQIVKTQLALCDVFEMVVS